jgi:hypothetical protein
MRKGEMGGSYCFEAGQGGDGKEWVKEGEKCLLPSTMKVRRKEKRRLRITWESFKTWEKIF